MQPIAVTNDTIKQRKQSGAGIECHSRADAKDAHQDIRFLHPDSRDHPQVNVVQRIAGC
jgi:hypothetical protein